MRHLTALLLVVLAACSSGDDDGSPPTTVTTPGSGTSSTSSTAASARAQGDTGSGRFTFKMPSGNIWCAVAADEARCDITDKTWTPPQKPADCELDWGHALVVDVRGSRFLCAGDTVQEDAAPVLPYGGVVERGDIRCRSDEDGVTCEHRAGGSRFLLSRQRYERS